MLAYEAEMMNWQADYIGVLEAGDRTLALGGWATVNNTSAENIEGAMCQFVAGYPHRNHLRPEIPRYGRLESGIAMASDRVGMAAEQFSEYYRYRLERSFSIRPAEQKRYPLFTQRPVPCRKQFTLLPEAYQNRPEAAEEVTKKPVAVFIQFSNTEADKLGLPLPEGQIRFFKHDVGGGLLFAGEDRIRGSSPGDTLTCSLGQSFDVSARRRQIAFTLLSSENRGGYAYESSRQIELFNQGKDKISVKVMEQIQGEWHILEEDHEHQLQSAAQPFWMIPVDPGAEARLTYTVRVKER